MSKLKVKFALAIGWTIIWFFISFYFAIIWVSDVEKYTGHTLAWIMVIGVAIIPGLAMSFINLSLLFDKRPKFDYSTTSYPPISIIIAAYNEEETIQLTLRSILEQHYQNDITIYVANDGSIDRTIDKVNEYLEDDLYKSKYDVNIILISSDENVGKANILNKALIHVKDDYVLTIDADSMLYKNALQDIVTHIVNRKEKYAAVAGTVLCNNGDVNFMTKIQEWDYYLGIASVKRIQSMCKATLVAQGAFSIYRKYVLDEIGGWPDTIGEDIVLTWKMHDLGYNVSYTEDAICYTNVPETYKIFFKQRRRWSRGLVEAFRNHHKLLFKWRMSTIFIWYNLMFPYIDIAFITVLLPGVIMAIFFNFYLLASKLTLYLLPMAFVGNLVMFFIQRSSLKKVDIKMGKNWLGLFVYMFFFQLIMTPATISGYISEILKRKRIWK